LRSDLLLNFAESEKITSKGKLCVVLVVTRNARTLPYPLIEDDFITGNEGQVKGLGRAAVQAVLKDYGITKILAEEGGRTSRGSMGLMKSYLAFLNEFTTREDLGSIEAWWIEKIKVYFNAKPFRFNIDNSKTISNAISFLIKQAERRQSENPGTMYVGALFQHLVGAKLAIAMPGVDLDYHGFSVADDSTARIGDFHIHDAIIHVTTFPQEALIRKCQRNLEDSKRPIIITSEKGFLVADSLLENSGIRERVDTYELTQFISINVNELSFFKIDNNRNTISHLLYTYNEIIDLVETDPSLKIDF